MLSLCVFHSIDFPTDKLDVSAKRLVQAVVWLQLYYIEEVSKIH